MTTSKALEQAMAQKFITAFTKYFGKKTEITVLETSYTPAQFTTLVQERVDARTDVETARGVYAKALAVAKAKEASTKAAYDGMRQLVLVTYASNPAVLAEFAMAPRKKSGPRDIAAKQAAILQMKATREARHTMGPRQRAKIKGVVVTATSDPTPKAPE